MVITSSKYHKSELIYYHPIRRSNVSRPDLVTLGIIQNFQTSLGNIFHRSLLSIISISIVVFYSLINVIKKYPASEIVTCSFFIFFNKKNFSLKVMLFFALVLTNQYFLKFGGVLILFVCLKTTPALGIHVQCRWGPVSTENSQLSRRYYSKLVHVQTQVHSLHPHTHNPMGRLSNTTGEWSGAEPMALRVLRAAGV